MFKCFKNYCMIYRFSDCPKNQEWKTFFILFNVFEKHYISILFPNNIFDNLIFGFFFKYIYSYKL